MHGGGVGIVECAEAADGVVGGRDFFEQGVEKIGGVEQVGESVLQGVGGGGELERGRAALLCSPRYLASTLPPSDTPTTYKVA